MGRFQFGQIVLAYVSDGHGRTKERPALIISRDEENEQGNDLQVVAITTKIEHPSPPYHVVIHDGSAPNPIHSLTARCVAKCNWVRDIEQRKVIRSLGRLPDDKIEKIVDQFDRIWKDPTFTDWA